MPVRRQIRRVVQEFMSNVRGNACAFVPSGTILQQQGIYWSDWTLGDDNPGLLYNPTDEQLILYTVLVKF